MQKIRHAMGVTLLEIMLVLALAATIIIMSIRYYQSASSSSKINAGLSDLQGIISAVDTYLASGGALSEIDCSATACTTLAPYLAGGKTPTNAWGGTVEVKVTGSTYTVGFNGVTTSDCKRFGAAATRNQKITVSSTDCTFTVSP